LVLLLLTQLAACGLPTASPEMGLPMYVTGSAEELEGAALAQTVARVARTVTWRSYRAYANAAPPHDASCRAEWRIEFAGSPGAHVTAEVRLVRSQTLLASAIHTSRRGGPKHQRILASAVRFAWMNLTEHAGPILSGCDRGLDVPLAMRSDTAAGYAGHVA
jgi:hypothetical protein